MYQFNNICVYLHIKLKHNLVMMQINKIQLLKTLLLIKVVSIGMFLHILWRVLSRVFIFIKAKITVFESILSVFATHRIVKKVSLFNHLLMSQSYPMLTTCTVRLQFRIKDINSDSEGSFVDIG